MNKIDLKSKIAIVLSIITFIVAVTNIFVKSEKMRVIVCGTIIIVYCLDFFVMLEQNSKLNRENIRAHAEIALWLMAIAHIEDTVRHKKGISKEARGELLAYIENEIEETRETILKSEAQIE